MALPPLEAGAVKMMVARASPDTTPLIAGAPGTVAGVTLLVALDAALGPDAFVATTVQV